VSANRRTVGFNFLREPELPAPQVSEAQAESILALHYGLTARANALGSQQDKNFAVEAPDGSVLGVLKIANPAFNATEVDAQDCAAEIVARREPSLRIAVPRVNLSGEKCTRVEGLLDVPALVRLLRFLPGGTLIESGYLSPATVAELGGLAGKLSRALAEFRHPGLDRVLQWDPRHAADVVAQLVEYVADSPLRLRLTEAADAAWARITSLSDRLPRQAVHLDLTDANVIVDPTDRHRPDGVIDFGDLSETWAICELAVTISSVLHHVGAAPAAVLPAVRAFHAIRPLSEEEIGALWPLAVMRTVVLIVSDAQQVLLDPGNEYVAAQVEPSLAKFARATSVPFDVMTALLKAELGFAATTSDVELAVALIAGLDDSTVTTLDLCPESDAMDGGAWLRDTVADDLAASATAAGAAAVITRYGEPRLDKSRPLRQHSPDVVATGLDLWLASPASPASMVAPWDGEVTAPADSVTVRGNVNEVEISSAQYGVGAGVIVRAYRTGAVGVLDTSRGASARSATRPEVRPARARTRLGRGDPRPTASARIVGTRAPAAGRHAADAA
jgi:Ser/Thr protein kinase RdoA (MazF antagonist)